MIYIRVEEWKFGRTMLMRSEKRNEACNGISSRDNIRRKSGFKKKTG